MIVVNVRYISSCRIIYQVIQHEEKIREINMSLKILHIASGFFPEYSGAPTRLYNLLSNQLYDILLFAPDRTFKGERIQQKEERFSNINVKRISLDRHKGILDAVPYLWYINDVNQKFKIFVKYAQNERFDIVHGHNPLGFGLAAKRIAQKSKTIFVYEAHGLNIDSYYTKITKLNPLFFLGYSYVKKNEASLMRDSDHIIAITQKIKKRICRVFNVSGDKITVIPNGVDLGVFSPKEEYKIKAKKIKKELRISGKVVMYAGAMDKVNGMLDIVVIIPEIIQKNPNIAFVLIGRGPEENKLAVLSKLYPKNIKFLGVIPYEQMPIYYQVADVFIIPRPSTMLAETVTPLKLLEAMAMEKTVLGSDVGGIAEVIRHGENGYLFEKGNMESFKETLLEVLDMGNTQIGKNARKTIVDNYTWDKSAKILQKVYDDLA